MFRKHRNTWYYYTKSQRRGFVALFVIILIVQVILLFASKLTYQTKDYSQNFDADYLEKKKYIDSLYLAANERKDTIYPFNPNYITDYRGQMLEMTIEEIDRLHRFRKENKFVNSVREFQAITQVSDEWIAKYSPFFQFPDWVTQKESNKQAYSNHKSNWKKSEQQEQIVKQDINQATSEDLQKVRGIGPVFSERIIKDRNKYGGYVSTQQLYFVYGLEEEVLDELKKYFEVGTLPAIKKINVNEASINELKEVPYLNYYIAREIVKYRSMNGDFTNKNDLKEIDKFPLDKIDIISLYLEFTN
jgi:DNA uptake protein ComE-like DNA-binding protein